MNPFKILLAYFVFCVSSSIAQTAYFEKIFGDSTDNSNAVSLIQLTSGNILVATNNLSIANSTNLIKLYKFDDSGNEQLHVNFPVTNYQSINKMKKTPEGNLLFAGVSIDSTGISDGMLMKTDTSGNIIWQYTYGQTLTDESLQGIDFTTQGEILSSGYTKNQGGPGHAFYLLKTDTAGNTIWEMDYPAARNSNSDAVIGLAHGDILISGDRQLASNNYTNTIIHADSLGNLTWDLEMPNIYNNGCKNDFLSSSGDVIIVGESATASSFSFDPAITRMDTAGNVEWSYIYNGSALSTDAAFDIIEPVAENYLVTGYALNPLTSSADVMLIRIDSAGNELARVYFGDSVGVDIGYAIINNQFANGCYIAGTSVRNSINRSYLVYTGLLGIQTGILETENPKADFNLYPNPCNNLLCFSTSLAGKTEITIYDFTGKQIKLQEKASNIFNTAQLAEGIYFAGLKYGNKTFYKKFVVMH